MNEHIEALAGLLDDGGRVAVLTGAGCSTDSGIPDYRDDDGEWKHARPVMYADFMEQSAVRQRYWARSMLGWPRMNEARPGRAHTALARLQHAGHIERLITQNVDGLHQAAGSEAVIDLHGRLDEVACQSCGLVLPRADWQGTIADANREFRALVSSVREAPDGDAIIEGADYGAFVVPACPRCEGIVKPEVVFFGENVPRERVDAAYAAVSTAHALLVVGSSLMVFSGFRFARRTRELDKPLFIMNRGRTRADDIATAKMSAGAAEALEALTSALGVPGAISA
ncbi:MAG: NAD-dependent protein deacetylase [Pseudomonadota bacterium]